MNLRRALVAVVASATMLATGVGVANATPGTPHKSYVCKYVGTPGVDERLQTGQNPIYVDNASLKPNPDGIVEVGDAFADKHGKSVVIVANTVKLDPEPTIDACPAAEPGEPGEVSASVSFIDPTCDLHADVVVVAAEGLDYTLEGIAVGGSTVTVTATAQEGYVLNGQSTWTHTFSATPTDCGSTPPPVVPPKHHPPKPNPPTTPTHNYPPTAMTGFTAGTAAIVAGLFGLLGALSLLWSRRMSRRAATG